MNFIKDAINLVVKSASRKPGFTLIEVVLSLSIFSIITSLFIGSFLSITGDFNKAIKDSREIYYLNEAFRYIEKDLSEDARSIEVYNNRIIVKKIDFINSASNLTHFIELEGERLVLKYSKYGSVNAVNNILRDIEEFRVNKSGKLIFIKIKFKEGKMMERCLGVRYVVN